MTSYERLAERLIETQRTMIGKRAVDIARSVEGLSVTDDGAVTEVADGDRTVIDDLVAAYVDVMGESARSRLTDVASEYEDLDLPESLGGSAVTDDGGTDDPDETGEPDGADEADGANVAGGADAGGGAVEAGATGQPSESGAGRDADDADLVTNIWGEAHVGEREPSSSDGAAIDVVGPSLDAIYVTVAGGRGEGPVPVDRVIVDAILAETDVDPAAIEYPSAYVSADEVVALAEADRDALTFEVEGHAVTLAASGAVTVE